MPVEIKNLFSNIEIAKNSPPAGFEPATFWLTARRYNHLATEAHIITLFTESYL